MVSLGGFAYNKQVRPDLSQPGRYTGAATPMRPNHTRVPHPKDVPAPECPDGARLIQLGGRYNSRIRGWAIVDEHDFQLLSRFSWSWLPGNYAYRKNNGRSEVMHRTILQLSEGDGQIVDHIDGNGMNNRRNNLRLVSQTDNSTNLHHRVKRRSKYGRGVFFDVRYGTFYVRCRASPYSLLHLGSFKTAEEARAAALAGRIKYGYLRPDDWK